MAKFKAEIKDEEQAHEHYESLAEKNPSLSKIFKNMAEDEEQHKKNLMKMHKSKVKSQAHQAFGGLYSK